MTGKIIDVLKNGNIVIPRLLLTSYKKLKITDQELIVLIYLMNQNEFNPEIISKNIGIEVIDVLNIIDSLSKKDILKIKNVKNTDVCEEVIIFDELYNKLALFFMDGDKEEKVTNIFDRFEKEFGRSLSPMEYEIIGAWLESGFNEEIIILALKEAVYNGVSNLRYIDRILFDWKKKGIKNKEDIKQNNKRRKSESPKEVFDYDWLNEWDWGLFRWVIS